MLTDDPSSLAAPRRAREAWEQAESIAATTLVQTIQAIVSALLSLQRAGPTRCWPVSALRLSWRV
jgi:uncharacterized membrane protein